MTMPITDLRVGVGRNAECPAGFRRNPVDLNRNVGKKSNYIWLFYKKAEQPKAEECITDLEVLVGKGVPASEGFTKIEIDLNRNAGGNYILLAYEKGGKDSEGKEKDPVKDIIVLVNKHEAPEGYHVIKKDLNRGAGGDTLFLAFQRGPAESGSHWNSGVDLDLFLDLQHHEEDHVYETEISRWQCDIDKQEVVTTRLEVVFGPVNIEPNKANTWSTKVFRGITREQLEKWVTKVGFKQEWSANAGVEIDGLGSLGIKNTLTGSFELEISAEEKKKLEEWEQRTTETTIKAQDYGYKVARVERRTECTTKSLVSPFGTIASLVESDLPSTFRTGKDGEWLELGQAV